MDFLLFKPQFQSPSQTTSYLSTNMSSDPVRIPIDLLDTQIHEIYNQQLYDPQNRRHQLLNILQTIAHVRQLGRSLNVIMANAQAATISIIHPIQNLFPFNEEVTDQVEELLSNFQRAQQVEIELHAHMIACSVIDQIAKVPEEGNPLEIEATKVLIKAYRSHIPTRPNSPSPSEESEEPKPITIRQSSSILNRDNEILGVFDQDMTEEVHRLKKHLFTTPTFPTPTEFNIPEDYTTWVKLPENASKQSYWRVIMTAFLTKNIRKGQYKGVPLEYAQAGPENAIHFIGYSDINRNWMIADSKKKLFATMVQ